MSEQIIGVGRLPTQEDLQVWQGGSLLQSPAWKVQGIPDMPFCDCQHPRQLVLFCLLRTEAVTVPVSPVPLEGSWSFLWGGAAHTSFLNSINIDLEMPWLLLMALLTFPGASERCQQQILLSSP